MKQEIYEKFKALQGDKSNKFYLDDCDVTYHRDLTVEAILPYLGGKCLEVGCGTGWLIYSVAKIFPDEIHTTIDKFDWRTHKTKNVKFFKVSAEEFETSHMFDVIILNQILEHLEAPIYILKKYYNMLNPGGRLIVAVPNLQGLMNVAYLPYDSSSPIAHIYVPHLYIFSKQILEIMLKYCKFKYEFLKYHIHIPCGYTIGKRIPSLTPILKQVERLLGKIFPIQLQPSLLVVITK